MNFVFITRIVPDATVDALRAALPDCRIVVNETDALSPAELIRLASGCDGLICTLADEINAGVLRALASRLRVVANYAVGVNNIALDTARELGITVCNTPDVLTDATAEIAVGLILACARRFHEGEAMVRAGAFRGWTPTLLRGRGVYGKTVGIVGAGRIGKRVAQTMRRGFDCRIVYHSRREHADWNELGAALLPLPELLAQSDFLSLHCPLTKETRHMIDASMLARMKPTAVLVNTARGPVVDETALEAALRTSRIAAAGFDVYENEPALSPGLRELDNVMLLPHIGSATYETRDEMGRMCARAVAAVLTGQEPPNRIA